MNNALDTYFSYRSEMNAAARNLQVAQEAHERAELNFRRSAEAVLNVVVDGVEPNRAKMVKAILDADDAKASQFMLLLGGDE